MPQPPESFLAGTESSTGDAHLAADRRKDEHIALLAHELRNLLAPIRYAAAAMEKSENMQSQNSYPLSVVRRQSALMSRLLDDLLDVSRFARGELELRKSATELTLVIGTAIEAARPVLDAKQHSLVVDLPEVPLRIWADPVRLIQVFSNLVINAAKYTDDGGCIEVRAAQESDAVIVSVRDSGIGIDKAMLPRIFTLFEQVHSARGRSEGGLGIGLALVHGLVTLHGGTITVHSEGCGRGSEFVVRLPISPFDAEAAVAHASVAFEPQVGLKILVVDDNRDVADTCAMLIELSGHQVRTSYTGRGGAELAETFRPDVILADIGLPDIDGYEFAKSIRRTCWGKTVTLVAITGWGEAEHKQQSLAAGFTHHLTKPIDPITIESLLRSVAGTRG